MTTVINIKDAPANWASDPRYVFIGRPSKWGNPYTLFKYSRDDCVKLYKTRVLPKLLLEAQTELKDKILVCYCKPKACHGDLLADAANRGQIS